MKASVAIPSSLANRRFNRALSLIASGVEPASAYRKVGLKRSTFYARYAKARARTTRQADAA